ncbi:MAG: ATP-binding protein, partial [Polyangiaceae bacterium]
GRPERLRVILRDVSRERSLEEQLRQGQKMDAIGRLASGIAHDFNNILTVIIGGAEQVQLTVDDERADKTLEMILDAGDRAAKLTQQLLTFGRSDLVHPKVHDLGELIREALPMLQRPLADRASLELSLAAEPLFIRIDVTQLTQLLLNLTFNAVDAMPTTGTVRIETTAGSDATVRLVVSDDGAGMAPDVLERACEPFFTTKDASEGSGLGLAVCYGIAKRNGGDLTIASTPGEGTAITLTFPRASAEDRVADLRAPRSRPAVTARHVLVVDDTEPVRRLVARALRAVGHDVQEASSAAEALASLERDPFDLLVTDVVMPGQGGVDLAEGAWSRRPELPVIFVSGYTGDRLGKAVLEKPHVRFLQKPFRAERLTELAASLLENVTSP